jgi:hypothetical protein
MAQDDVEMPYVRASLPGNELIAVCREALTRGAKPIDLIEALVCAGEVWGKAYQVKEGELANMAALKEYQSPEYMRVGPVAPNANHNACEYRISALQKDLARFSKEKEAMRKALKETSEELAAKDPKAKSLKAAREAIAKP